MQAWVYSRQQIQAWEQSWFTAGNSSYGLMQQAAWHMQQAIVQVIVQYSDSMAQALRTTIDANINDANINNDLSVAVPSVGVWCGTGNNAGDGWLVAGYLKQAGYPVWVYEVSNDGTLSPDKLSPDASRAKAFATQQGVQVYQQLDDLPDSTFAIDALFGIGLNREVTEPYKAAIEHFNQRAAYKVALDIPSGIDADTGAVMGVAVKAQLTLTVIGYKAGLFTGQGKAHTGRVQLIDLIPRDLATNPSTTALAQLDNRIPKLPKRSATGHKGTYGHVLIIGGDENMGGAAIMAAEAALASGAGKVSLLTHAKNHAVALTRCPNLMTLDMPDIQQLDTQAASKLAQGMDCIVIGMGLGRHAWGKAVWQAFLPVLETSSELENSSEIKTVVIDADALWHLADQATVESNISILSNSAAHTHWYLTPHSGEAARLLNTDVSVIEQDRIAAIYALKEKFGGHCLLKGAGSLSLDDAGLSICALGNAGMGTAGMGDVLAGMAGGLLAQLPDLPLHQIVALHAAAGDLLAEHGERGVQAPHMIEVIGQVVN